MSEFTLRPALISDAEEIHECLHVAFEPFRERYTPQGFVDTVPAVEDIRGRMHFMSLFVAEDENRRVIGTIGCHLKSPEEGHIRGMAVLPEWQGTGVAQRLMETAEAELRQRGISRVSLDTTDPLQRAIRFYEKQGYRRSGAIGDHFGMPLYEFVKELSRR